MVSDWTFKEVDFNINGRTFFSPTYSFSSSQTSVVIILQCLFTRLTSIMYRAGQINRTRKPDRIRSDKNESEPIRTRLKYRMDLVLWYFELWVLSEPNPNLNGYPIEPKTFKTSKRSCTKHDLNS